MDQIMTDIETMSRRPNGAIVSIGAVKFDETGILGEFHVPIALGSCQSYGLHVERDTVEFWDDPKQAAARATWDVQDAVTLPDGLKVYTSTLEQWGHIDDRCMWANGPDFDLVMLRSAFQAVDLLQPWHFWNQRCHRTMKCVLPTSFDRQRAHHSALDDAKYQALQLIEIFKRRGLTFE